jgi:hypothetical protein
MGIERSFQAIPGGCNLIERARTQYDLGESLSLVGYYFKRGEGANRGPMTPIGVELDGIVREMIAADPGLAARNHYVDKRWDQIHFLLSGKYRGEPAESQDALFDIAIEGENLIAAHVCGGQGIPLRYTSPQTVKAVAGAFENIDVESLKRRYNLATMEERGIYKAFAGRESEEDWGYLRSLILELRAFYLDAAKCRNGVLVSTD